MCYWGGKGTRTWLELLWEQLTSSALSPEDRGHACAMFSLEAKATVSVCQASQTPCFEGRVTSGFF